MLRIDARVPLRFGAPEDARPCEAILSEGMQPGYGATFDVTPGLHLSGCPCCVKRSGAALALADLFTRRARGAIEFRSVLVVASEAGRMAVLEALQSDPVASARFRLG